MNVPEPSIARSHLPSPSERLIQMTDISRIGPLSHSMYTVVDILVNSDAYKTSTHSVLGGFLGLTFSTYPERSLYSTYTMHTAHYMERKGKRRRTRSAPDRDEGGKAYHIAYSHFI